MLIIGYHILSSRQFWVKKAKGMILPVFFPRRLSKNGELERLLQSPSAVKFVKQQDYEDLAIIGSMQRARDVI
ncbi:MAG: hypothetical protein KAU38_08615 [Desulfobacterales bacterium]|nr:hypothetical protein [Desulfobacterales bacterium]